jgi:hypothetical protein
VEIHYGIEEFLEMHTVLVLVEMNDNDVASEYG